jgi:hypothetical protein
MSEINLSQENNPENNPENNQEPLIQLKQECIYCLCPLLEGEEVAIYNGNCPLYKDWICHKDCIN